MQIEFSQIVRGETDRLGLEMTVQQIHSLLENEYFKTTSLYVLTSHRLQEENSTSAVDLEVSFDSEKQHWRGIGKGPLGALMAALPVKAEVVDYHEYAIGAGTNVKAVVYIEIRLEDQRPLHGIGIDENIATASPRALFSAPNRAMIQAEAKAA